LTLPPTGQMCETKPICPATPRGTRPEGRGTKGKCAKRTQFCPSAGIRRRIVQNEANFSISDCGLRTGDRPAAQRPIVQNEPNSRLCRGDEAWGQLCETKPIRNKSGVDAQPTKRRLCKTKPNLGRLGYLGDGDGGAHCAKHAKRSQFVEEFQVLRRARPWSGLQTSHITLQTRPKAVRAKQSQLPEAGHRGGVRPGPARWMWNPPPYAGRTPIPTTPPLRLPCRCEDAMVS